jgi:protein SCO1/2
MDQQRRPATPERFAGTYQLVFFGFTHCPSICPTELQRLSLVLKNLTPAEKEKLSAIFVTVDPARDTPATLREYLSMFDPEIIGLTGTGIAVERVLANWKVYAAKVQTAEMSDYTMDHSAFLYFRGPDGRLIDLFDAGDTPDGITQTVRAHLGG